MIFQILESMRQIVSESKDQPTRPLSFFIDSTVHRPCPEWFLPEKERSDQLITRQIVTES